MAKVTDWGKYAPEFADHEFNCKSTGRNEMQVEFMDKLHELRKRYGKGMIITSGYRHWTHPVEARKGHKNGEHTKGMCADIACTNSQDRFQLVKLALEMGFTRIGFHKTFLHLGMSADMPQNVLWDY
jgi:uncharacterized protein YcbK (DUF882 family)